MKRFIIIISAILAIICFTGCPSPEAASSDDENEEIVVTNSDWLFVLYMDADNNLNDDLWWDITREQYAIAEMLQDEDTFKEGFPSVKIVMLWDGESAEGAEVHDNTRIHSRSEIYEIGPMDINTDAKLFPESGEGDSSWLISSYSKRLTDKADWLKKEPDMGDVNTLKNFLSWVNERYSAKNKVLLLSDHGAGTEWENADGGIVYQINKPRSLCGDDTNGTHKILTALDVKNAISSSKFRPNIIYMDCCLQGNAETAYLLRGSADYLVSSVNSSYANNHYVMLKCLTDTSTPKDFACSIVNCYATSHMNNTLNLSEDRYHASFEETLTSAVYDLNLTKQSNLYYSFNRLCSLIMLEPDEVKNKVYESYLYQNPENTEECKGMAYSGTYYMLNDIGYFCKNLAEDPSNTGVIAATKEAARDVISDLQEIIVCSWMGKNNASGTQCYYAKSVCYLQTGTEPPQPVPITSKYNENDGQFGLTIASQGVEENLTTFFCIYSNMTGYCDCWEKLLNYWYHDIMVKYGIISEE